MIKNVIFSMFFAIAAGTCLGSAAAQEQTPTPTQPSRVIPPITRYCSARPAAKAVADSLVIKFKNILQPMVDSKAITRPSVRVAYSGPRVRLQRIPIDFASGLDVGFNSQVKSKRITMTGAPDNNVIYASCDAGPTLFTVSISYRVIEEEQQTAVSFREKFELSIPGQYF